MSKKQSLRLPSVAIDSQRPNGLCMLDGPVAKCMNQHVNFRKHAKQSKLVSPLSLLTSQWKVCELRGESGNFDEGLQASPAQKTQGSNLFTRQAKRLLQLHESSRRKPLRMSTYPAIAKFVKVHFEPN